jgi:hypothetical protein
VSAGEKVLDRLRLRTILPKSYEQDPEEPVSILEAWSPNIPFQDIELIPEREVFQGERATRPQPDGSVRRRRNSMEYMI